MSFFLHKYKSSHFKKRPRPYKPLQYPFTYDVFLHFFFTREKFKLIFILFYTAYYGNSERVKRYCQQTSSTADNDGRRVGATHVIPSCCLKNLRFSASTARVLMFRVRACVLVENVVESCVAIGGTIFLESIP